MYHHSVKTSLWWYLIFQVFFNSIAFNQSIVFEEKRALNDIGESGFRILGDLNRGGFPDMSSWTRKYCFSKAFGLRPLPSANPIW